MDEAKNLDASIKNKDLYYRISGFYRDYLLIGIFIIHFVIFVGIIISKRLILNISAKPTIEKNQIYTKDIIAFIFFLILHIGSQFIILIVNRHNDLMSYMKNDLKSHMKNTNKNVSLENNKNYSMPIIMGLGINIIFFIIVYRENFLQKFRDLNFLQKFRDEPEQ